MKTVKQLMQEHAERDKKAKSVVATGPAFSPPMALLIKLGSAIVHADEMMSPSGHDVDKIALKSLIDDPEVKAWVAEMTKLGFMPIKR